jgi:hypothetical protein
MPRSEGWVWQTSNISRHWRQTAPTRRDHTHEEREETAREENARRCKRPPGEEHLAESLAKQPATDGGIDKFV